MSVQSQAAHDAAEYARAYMSYGEGAGTRRKLINGTIDYKMKTVPGYADAFYRAAEKQDMAKHAGSAKRADRRRTVNSAVARNTRALATGRYQDVNTFLFAAGAALYFAHRYGVDKKIVETGKRKYNDLRNRFRKIPKVTTL